MSTQSPALSDRLVDFRDFLSNSREQALALESENIRLKAELMKLRQKVASFVASLADEQPNGIHDGLTMEAPVPEMTPDFLRDQPPTNQAIHEAATSFFVPEPAVP